MTASELDPQVLLSIDGSTVVLSSGHDVDDLQRRMQEAVVHPQFVQVTAANGNDLRFLISVRTHVTIAVIPPWVVPEQPPRVDLDTLEIFDL